MCSKGEVMSISLQPTLSKHVSFGKNSEQKPNKPKSNETINGFTLPGTKRLNYSPLTIGVLNGACWVGVGMLIDKLMSKFYKKPINSKVSLAIQSALGLYMGYQAYKVAKNEVKNA